MNHPMKAPSIFLSAVALMILASCQSCAPRQSSELPPPNILWITCEDISSALGCYGDDYARTPVLDRLAGEGVRYTRAFATAPICAPARSTLISGVYATTMGTQHLRSDIPMPEDFRILPEYLRDVGYFCSNNAKTDYNFDFTGRWDDQGNEAHWRNRPEGQPFFSVFNYGITHEGPTNRLDPSETAVLRQRHDPDMAELPPYFPDTPQMRKIWAHQYDLISVLDQQVEELLDQLKEDGLYDQTIIFFFSDHGFGLPRYKRWLYRTGLQVPFILWAPEKYRHLLTAGPGKVEERMVSFVDFAPSVLSLAGVEIPEHMAGSSFLGREPSPERTYIFGARSRADDIYEVSRCVMDERYIYIRNYLPHQPYVTDAIIFSDSKASFRELRRLRENGELTPEAEQFWQPKAYEELYDLETDPDELNNLAGDLEYGETVARMRGVLYEWMLEHRDVGLLNESEMMARSRGSSPYEMGATEAYAVDEVLQAANLCGEPETTLEEILPILDHPDAGVRYWGVRALQAMGHDILSLKASQLLEDPSPTVAVAAAQWVGLQGDTDLAFPVLERYLRATDHPTLVLQAAIAAREMGEKAKPLIPVIDEVFPSYRGEVWNRYRSWSYPMFIGFALDQVYLNCGMEIPE